MYVRPARSLALGLLCAALAASVCATPAAAQVSGDVQRAIQITDDVILRASAALQCGAADDRLACQYLSQASILQDSAKNSLAAGFLRDALALTFRARDRVYSALRLSTDATHGEFVRFVIERTDALLDRVAPVVRESGNEQAQRLLDVAFDLQRRAKDLGLEGGRPRAALSLTQQARERALRALRLAEGTASSNPERARRVLDRTDELLRESAWLEASVSSGHAYDAAVQMQQRARERWDAGQPAAAVEQSLRARGALERALHKADRPAERPAVEKALRTNAEEIADARARAGSDAGAVPLLDLAEDLQRQAQGLYEQGRLAQAMAQLRASMDVVARVRK